MAPTPVHAARILSKWQRCCKWLSKFCGTRITLPLNLVFAEWDLITHLEEDGQMVQFLQFGFPADYEGPVLTSTSVNHPLGNTHLKDVTVYVAKELSEGVMLSPFDNPPLMPWFQINSFSPDPRRTALITGS